MKNKKNPKEKLKTELDKGKNKLKGMHEKIMKRFNNYPAFRKLAISSNPLREKLMTNFNKARGLIDHTQKGIQDFKKRCKAEPKKTIKETFVRVRKIMVVRWPSRRERHAPMPVITKSTQSTKSERVGSVAAGE